ncbi:hypothetical protein UXN57_00780 [Enterobacter hormaechei]
METVIPLVIVFALLLQAVSYARVVFLRRHWMMPMVERYVRRPDASPVQKKIATEAFQDALTFSLPLNLLLARRAQEKADRVELPGEKEFLDHCTQKTSANEALGEIIQVMLRLNLKFNTPLHLVCLLSRLRVRSFALAEVHTVQEQVGNAYVDLKHQHQHV